MNSTSSENLDFLPWHICCVVCGVLFSTCSFLIALCIMRYNALRTTKQFVLVAGLSLADAFNLTGVGFAGTYRIYRVFQGTFNTKRTPWECFLLPHNLILSWAEFLASVMLCVISVDRLLAVGRPLQYFKFGQRYALCMIAGPCCLSFCYAIAFGVFAYTADQIPGVPAMCGLGQLLQPSAPAFIVEIHEKGGSVFPAISVLLYVVVWVLYKKHGAKVTSQQLHAEQHRQEKRQRQMTKSFGISSLCTLLLAVLPMLAGHKLFFAGYPNLGFFMFIVTFFNPFCNFFIYSLRHAEIRKGLRRLFKCKEMPASLDLWHATPKASRMSRAMMVARRSKAVDVAVASHA